MTILDDKELKDAALPLWIRIVGLIAFLGLLDVLISDEPIITSLTGLGGPVVLSGFGFIYVAVMVWQWRRVRKFLPAKETKRQAKTGIRVALWIIAAIVVMVVLSVLGLEIFGDTSANRRIASLAAYGATTLISLFAVIYIIRSTAREFVQRSRPDQS